jgi:hypothetical protein
MKENIFQYNGKGGMYMIYGVALAVSMLCLTGIAYFIPKRWSIDRTAHIQASAEPLYNFLLHLKNWPEWQMDNKDEVVFLYVGNDSGEGAAQYWETDGVQACLRIIRCEHLKNIHYCMRINQGETMLNFKFEFQQAEGFTALRWRCQGISMNNPLERYASLLYRWRVRQEMKKALDKLKEVYRLQEKMKQSA